MRPNTTLLFWSIIIASGEADDQPTLIDWCDSNVTTTDVNETDTDIASVGDTIQFGPLEKLIRKRQVFKNGCYIVVHNAEKLTLVDTEDKQKQIFSKSEAKALCGRFSATLPFYQTQDEHEFIQRFTDGFTVLGLTKYFLANNTELYAWDNANTLVFEPMIWRKVHVNDYHYTVATKQKDFPEWVDVAKNEYMPGISVVCKTVRNTGSAVPHDWTPVGGSETVKTTTKGPKMSQFWLMTLIIIIATSFLLASLLPLTVAIFAHKTPRCPAAMRSQTRTSDDSIGESFNRNLPADKYVHIR